MIAEAMVVSGLPPSAFGVEPSAELGAEVLEVLQEQGRAARSQAMLARLKREQ